MRHFCFAAAAMWLCVATATADPMAQTFAADAKKEMPGSVVSKHIALRPNLADQQTTEAPIVGSCPTATPPGTADCHRGHARGRGLIDWLCYHSSRPGECTLTPTSYRPPLYTYFPCKGIGGACVVPTMHCAPPVAPAPTLPAPTAVSKNAPAPVAVAVSQMQASPYGGGAAMPSEPVTVSKPQPLPPRLQGPLLPGSAAAANVMPAMAVLPPQQVTNSKQNTSLSNPGTFYSPSRWNEIKAPELRPQSTNPSPLNPPAAGYPRLP
jgi:hypothetical protein